MNKNYIASELLQAAKEVTAAPRVWVESESSSDGKDLSAVVGVTFQKAASEDEIAKAFSRVRKISGILGKKSRELGVPDIAHPAELTINGRGMAEVTQYTKLKTGFLDAQSFNELESFINRLSR